MLENQLERFRGKVVKSVTCYPFHVDGRGPFSLWIQFEDGASLQTTFHEVPFRMDFGNGTFEEFLPEGTLSFLGGSK